MTRKIAILGAGISGLSLAWFLKQRFDDAVAITLIEQSDRPGGWIQTVEQDGFLFERGPRSCRTYGSGEATLELVEALGMQDEVITPSPAAHKRYILEKEKLHKISFYSPSFFKDIVRGLFRDLRAPITECDDTSIFEFVSRRFGRSIAERLFDPMTLGIYAGDIRTLSMRSCFPPLFEAEKRSGSVLWGLLKPKRGQKKNKSDFVKKIQKASLFSLKKGMQSLTDRLASALAPSIRYNTKIDSLSEINADHIYSTLPAHVLARLLPDPFIQNLLQQIPFQSISAVHLGYTNSVLNQEGFGYLVPSKENASILGVVWDSCIFPQQNRQPTETRLTVMVRGADQTNDSLIDCAREAIRNHLGINDSPSSILTTSAKQAIPQYLVGHSPRLQQLERLISDVCPKLSLHGSSFYGVSVNDCIARSANLSLASLIID